MTAAEFRAYVDAQEQAAMANRMSIINSAMSGRFSTVRTMEEYNREIWHLEKMTPMA